MDVSLEEAAVKKRKKSGKKGVYRPKIQIDVVFRRSTPPAAKKAGKEGVALAGERSVLSPEIGVGIGGRRGEGGGVEVEKKVEEERAEARRRVGEGGVEMVRVEEVGTGTEEDGTPPPKPMAMTRTCLRRNGPNAKRCLDFGLGKSNDQVLRVAAAAEARVGEEAMAPPMRKPRTKRARSVKRDYANPAGEWSSLLSKNKSFNKSGGRGSS